MFLDYDDYDLLPWGNPNDLPTSVLEDADELDDDDDHPSLTAAERNPSLCR